MQKQKSLIVVISLLDNSDKIEIAIPLQTLLLGIKKVDTTIIARYAYCMDCI